MKRALPYNILVVFLLFPLISLATNGSGKYTKKKVINKEYAVSSNATLKVSNSYGNIDVVTWNENRIVFEITITTTGNDEEKVQEKLDGIDVEFEASSSNVAVRTKFSKKSKSWWNWKGKNNVKMEINYVIKTPITNSVNLDNNYGNINVASLEGRASISCDYGRITTKELFADDNSITFDYSKNCYFEYIKSGKINADYSGFTVAKTNALSIDADYSNSTVEVAEDVNYNCDYGNIKIEKANNVVGNGDYLTAMFGDIYKSMKLNADYGAIKINRVNESTKNVIIDADYVGIKLGYAAGYNFNFDFNLSYSSLKGGDNLEYSRKEVKSNSKKYTGYHGSSTSGNLIKINSSYGSISMNKN